MFKFITRKLAFPLILLMMTVSVTRGFAATGNATPRPSPARTSAPAGVTGTDPEPSRPHILYVILEVIYLL